MQNIEPQDFVQTVLEAESRYLVLFYADWCQFCARFKPIFEGYENHLPALKLAGAKVNEDDNPLWDMFKIDSIPTMIAFDDGRIVARRDAAEGVGLTKSDMESMLEELGRAAAG